MTRKEVHWKGGETNLSVVLVYGVGTWIIDREWTVYLVVKRFCLYLQAADVADSDVLNSFSE